MEVTKPIKVGNYWTNLVDTATGENVNYEQTLTWVDGTPMDDSKADGVIYRKLPASVGGGYVKRVFPDGVINVMWFGAVGDELTDDTAAIQAAANIAKSLNRTSSLGPNTTVLIPKYYRFATYDTITIPDNVNLDMQGQVRYRGVMDRPAIVLGTAGVAQFNVEHTLNLVTVRADSDWSEEEFVGVRLYNSNGGKVNITLIDGFYKGFECIGENGGFAYNQVYIQTLNSNKYGVYLRKEGTGWINENIFYNGRFSTQNGFNQGQTRVGVRITGDDNRFICPSFELNRGTSTPGFSHAALFEDAVNCKIFHCRNEGNSAANVGNGGYAFIIEGSSRNNEIDVAYTWDRSRGMEATAFLDNSTTKQNRYTSIENVWQEVTFGDTVYDSGDMPSKFSPTSANIASCPGVMFLSRAGVLSAYTPNDVTARVVRGYTNNIGYVELLRTAFAVRIHTDDVKKFGVLRDSWVGRGGRVGLKFYDEAGTEITSSDPIETFLDAQSSDLAANQAFEYSSEYGGCWLTGTPASGRLPVYFSVKEQVKYVLVFVGNPAGFTSLRRFTIKSLENIGKIPAISINKPSSDFNRRFNSSGTPTAGTFVTGELFFQHNPGAGEPLIYVVSSPGTETPISATGDYSSGTVIDNISDISIFTVGDFIDIQGFSGQWYRVVSIDEGNSSITINSPTGATPGTGLTITNHAPSWKKFAHSVMVETGTVTPEGNISGARGAIYHQYGTGTVTHPLFVKTEHMGNEGWKYLLTEDDRTSVASADTATVTDPDAQAVLDELRDLKTKMRAAGLLAT